MTFEISDYIKYIKKKLNLWRLKCIVGIRNICHTEIYTTPKELIAETAMQLKKKCILKNALNYKIK